MAMPEAYFEGSEVNLTPADIQKASETENASPHQGLNENEKRVFDALARGKWVVLRRGWPDFLAFQLGPNATIKAAAGIEVKTRDRPCTEDQVNMHAILRAIGIPCFVIQSEDIPDGGALCAKFPE